MRRLLLTLACLLIGAVPVSAQVSLVSGQSAVGTGGSFWVTASLDETLNFPSAVTSGNTVVAWTLWADSRRTMSCTHDGNAMTAITTKGASSAGSDPIVVLFARVATTTGTGVTCTISAADNNGIQSFGIAEFAGLAATLSTQGGAGVNNTTAVETTSLTTHDSGADLTPDTAHNLVLGAVICTSDGGTWGDDGHTLLVSIATRRLGYLIQSSATAQDWAPTTSNSVSCEVVAQILDGAAAGGGSTAKPLTLLGVG